MCVCVFFFLAKCSTKRSKEFAQYGIYNVIGVNQCENILDNEFAWPEPELKLQYIYKENPEFATAPMKTGNLLNVIVSVFRPTSELGHLKCWTVQYPTYSRLISVRCVDVRCWYIYKYDVDLYFFTSTKWCIKKSETEP